MLRIRVIKMSLLQGGASSTKYKALKETSLEDGKLRRFIKAADILFSLPLFFFYGDPPIGKTCFNLRHNILLKCYP